jgi:hypothetical protein
MTADEFYIKSDFLSSEFLEVKEPTPYLLGVNLDKVFEFAEAYHKEQMKEERPRITKGQIRDMVITGSFAIGPNGLKEPVYGGGWEEYANRLEDMLIENNGLLTPNPER